MSWLFPLLSAWYTVPSATIYWMNRAFTVQAEKESQKLPPSRCTRKDREIPRQSSLNSQRQAGGGRTINACAMTPARGVVPSAALPSARVLLTCKTPAFVGAAGGNAPPPGAQRPCPGNSRARAARPGPPPRAGIAAAPPPPRLPGRRQPSSSAALRRPAPRPSCGRLPPAAPAAFRAPAQVRVSSPPGPGTRGGEGGERRVPQVPSDADA